MTVCVEKCSTSAHGQWQDWSQRQRMPSRSVVMSCAHQLRAICRVPIVKNGGCVDPTTRVQDGRIAGNRRSSHSQGNSHSQRCDFVAAAKELSTRPQGRRRVIYVISDGKEYGSKATYKDVVRYLADEQDRSLRQHWWATLPVGAWATRAGSTCPSPCMTIVWLDTSSQPAAFWIQRPA